MATTSVSRGYVRIAGELCKGCGLCVEACPAGVIRLTRGLNRQGFHPAKYSGQGCSGCGICFFVCPEPGAMVVYRVSQGGNQMAAAS